MMDRTYEVAIVGAGPIGLELAVAMKKAGVNYVHFDAKQIGYTISWFAPQTKFFSSNERIAIAGVPLETPDQGKSTREQYLTYLRTVAGLFDLQVNTYEPVTTIRRAGDFFHLETKPASGPRSWRAKKIVLCTGGTDRPRRIDVEGEDLPHVSHYFDDPHKYFRKNLLIVGGRNSAIEAALRCHHAGANVSLSYRRDTLHEKDIKYWLLPEIKGLIKSGRIPAYFNSCVRHITPTHVRLGRVGDPEHDVPADFVLLLTGYEQDNALLKAASVDLTGACSIPLYDPETMQTPTAGLYVAGTAIGGTQEKYSVFIENCHEHVEKIMKHLFGVRVESRPLTIDAPES